LKDRPSHAHLRYAARDIEGRPISGTLSGPNERAIREQLRDRELYVTRVAAQGAAGSKAAGAEGGFRPFAKRVKLYDIVVFSRQLSTLVKAGLQLTQALTALSRQTKNPTLRAATEQIQKEIATGTSLTTAMKQHPRIFSEMYLSLAEAGELGGMLDETLDTAATRAGQGDGDPREGQERLRAAGRGAGGRLGRRHGAA
jgi:type IV pilus assembly protein PilC